MSSLFTSASLKDLISTESNRNKKKKHDSEKYKTGLEALVESIIKQETGGGHVKYQREIKTKKSGERTQNKKNTNSIVKSIRSHESKKFSLPWNNIYSFAAQMGLTKEQINSLENGLPHARKILMIAKNSFLEGYEYVSSEQDGFVDPEQTSAILNFADVNVDKFVLSNAESISKTISTSENGVTSKQKIIFDRWIHAVLSDIRLRELVTSVAQSSGMITEEDQRLFGGRKQNDFGVNSFQSAFHSNVMNGSAGESGGLPHETRELRHASSLADFRFADEESRFADEATIRSRSQDGSKFQQHGEMLTLPPISNGSHMSASIAGSMHSNASKRHKGRSSSISDKKLKELGGFDGSFARQTPRVLRPNLSGHHSSGISNPLGSSANTIAELRRELRLANEGISRLDSIVENNISWVQSNCDLATTTELSSKAKQKCKQMAIDRLFNVLVNNVSNRLQISFRKWIRFVRFTTISVVVKQYYCLKSLQLLAHFVGRKIHGKYTKYFARWSRTVALQQRWGQEIATVEIQRIVRGRIGRNKAKLQKQAVLEAFRQKKIIVIQKRVRGIHGRKQFKVCFEKKKQELAIKKLQKWCRDSNSIYRAKEEASRRRELKVESLRIKHKAAINIQNMLRARLARERVNRIRHKKHELVVLDSKALKVQHYLRRVVSTKPDREMLKSKKEDRKNKEKENATNKKEGFFSKGLNVLSGAFGSSPSLSAREPSTPLKSNADETVADIYNDYDIVSTPLDNDNDIDKHNFGKDVDAAAIKLQTITRGRQGRKVAENKKADQKKSGVSFFSRNKDSGYNGNVEASSSSSKPSGSSQHQDMDNSSSASHVKHTDKINSPDVHLARHVESKPHTHPGDNQHSKSASLVKHTVQSNIEPNKNTKSDAQLPSHSDSIGLEKRGSTPPRVPSANLKDKPSSAGKQTPARPGSKDKERSGSPGNPSSRPDSPSKITLKTERPSSGTGIDSKMSDSLVSSPKKSSIISDDAKKSTAENKKSVDTIKKPAVKDSTNSKENSTVPPIDSSNRKKSAIVPAPSEKKTTTDSNRKSVIELQKDVPIDSKPSPTVAKKITDEIKKSTPKNEKSVSNQVQVDQKKSSDTGKKLSSLDSVESEKKSKDSDAPSSKISAHSKDKEKLLASPDINSKKQPASKMDRPTSSTSTNDRSTGSSSPPKTIKKQFQNAVETAPAEDKISSPPLSSINNKESIDLETNKVFVSKEHQSSRIESSAPSFVTQEDLISQQKETDENFSAVDKSTPDGNTLNLIIPEDDMKKISLDNGNANVDPTSTYENKKKIANSSDDTKEPNADRRNVNSLSNQEQPRIASVDFNATVTSNSHIDSADPPVSNNTQPITQISESTREVAEVNNKKIEESTKPLLIEKSKSPNLLNSVSQDEQRNYVEKSASGSLLSSMVNNIGGSFKRVMSPGGSSASRKQSSSKKLLSLFGLTSAEEPVRDNSPHKKRPVSRANMDDVEKQTLDESLKIMEAQRKAREYIEWAVITIQCAARRMLSKKMRQRLKYQKKLNPKEWIRPAKNSKYYSKPKDLSKKTTNKGINIELRRKRNIERIEREAREREAAINAAANPEVTIRDSAHDNKVKELDEKLQKLNEVEHVVMEREQKIAEMMKVAEQQARDAAEAVARFQVEQKKVEEDRLQMQRMLEMAAGPLSHRTDIMSTNGAIINSDAPDTFRSGKSSGRRGSKSGQLSARDRGIPPTALSARGGAAIPADAATVLHDGDSWVQLWDPDENSWYWYNRRTQVAQWEYPGTAAGYNSGYESEGGMTEYSGYSTDYASGYDSDAGKVAGSPWQEFWDEQAQAKYWYNNLTGEATWTKPLESSSRVNSARKYSASSHGDDWISYVDEHTGQEYWYNAVTGETSWS